jgi:hypothetical protein
MAEKATLVGEFLWGWWGESERIGHMVVEGETEL